jgi:nitrite reductase/ring-hydroxylating ferredoxin subunit
MTPGDPEPAATPDGRSARAQPQWRQDFPIDCPEAQWVARREFVKFLLLVSGAFSAGQLWLLWRGWRRAAAPTPPPSRVARASDVPVGGSLLFQYPAGSPSRLLVRVDDATFVAYEQQCTHLSCPVLPAVARGELICPCHHGVFELRTGRPIAGPPRRPLARVALDVRDGWVVATGIEPRVA